MLDSFTASPAAPLPGQTIQLRLDVHDPDCTAVSCTSGCGTCIRPDLFSWSDDSGRSASSFSSTQLALTGSPWYATANWLAPSAAGIYTISASVSDNGSSSCGERMTKVFTLQVVVSSAESPTVTSCSVNPLSVPAGGTAAVSATATDPLGRPLTFSFSAAAGSIVQSGPGTGAATWTAPATAGSVIVRCRVDAGATAAVAQTTASVEIGAYLRQVESPDLSFTRVAGLPDGRIAAVDGVNGILAVLSTQGTLSWKKLGLETPVAVAVSGGEIYVVERGAARISVWSAGGQRAREIPLAVSLPNQLIAGPGPGELAVTDIDTARVVIMSAQTGQVLRTLGGGVLRNPAGMAASNGRLAVADAAAARVYLYSAAGVVTKTIGSSSMFVRPQGVAWDEAAGRLVVADTYSGELKIVGEEGSVRGTLGGFGTAAGQLVNPIDVALLPGGTLAVPTGGGGLPLYRLLSTSAPLQPPTGVVAEDRAGDDGGAVAVRWALSPDDPARVTTYRIERAAGQEEVFQVVGTVASGTSSYTDSTAATGTCYRYRVACSDGSEDAFSGPTACAVAVNDLPPAVPQNALAEADSPFEAWVEWDPVAAPDLSAYLVDFTAGAATVSVQTAETSVVVANLQPDTRYTVSLRSVDTAGNRSAPSLLTISTWPDVAPATPTGVEAKDAGTSGEILVTWSAVQSPVPVDLYRVEVTPLVSGWPAPVVETSSTEARVRGLVNTMEYRVSVISLTPWDRASEPSASCSATPTAPARTLPVIHQTDEPQDVAGMTVRFTTTAQERLLRFQYRSSGTMLQASIDGSPAGLALPDSGGQWTDGTVEVLPHLLKGDGGHTLELRSSAFPAPGTSLAIRRIDFVPLAPLAVGFKGYNTVADVGWRWQEWRADLGVVFARDGAELECRAPQLGICRAAFLENAKKSVWTLTVVSPAGWLSQPARTQGAPRWNPSPPPVTDLLVLDDPAGLRLTWTPLSTAIAKAGPAAAVAAYRVYVAGSLVGQVEAPPALIPVCDPALVQVRSVDAEGRESR